jgi:eukaryotic-like serine/threonine-protein kinase
MPLSAGDKLGPYEIVESIGKGGMGEVYRARDPRLNRDVAIKVSAAQFSERFEREAKAIAALNHPNICHLYDVGPNYLVMEYIEGEAPQGPLPLEEALRIAKQICDALEAAHEKGITHRDLKPGNIKIKPDGTVKVLDFGLAKVDAGSAVSQSENSPTLSMAATQMGVILGTAGYMSPEQARGKPVDKRADIWAFGVVLYELLMGKRLFQGEDVSHTMAAVIMQEPNLDVVPVQVRKLLQRCLEKDPKKRLRDISGVELLLESGTGLQPVSAPQAKARGTLPWVVAAVAALAAVGTFAFFHLREEPQPNVVKLEFPPPANGTLSEGAGPPAVSPDGRRIAFRAEVDGKIMLWVRDLDSLTSRTLPGTENAGLPFWAPDSRQLAFFSTGKLMKIDVTGGPATTITNSSNPRGGTWSQDDVILFSDGSNLLRVSAAGGTPIPVTELDKTRNEASHYLPQLLPDGHHFLYLAQSGDAEKTAIFVGDLQSNDTKNAKKLVLQSSTMARYVEPAGGAGNGYLLFVRENTLMAQPFDAGKLQTTGDAVPVAEYVDTPQVSYGYFGASRNGTLAYTSGGGGADLQITWLDRSGKAVGTVGKPANVQTPRLSPNGKMVAYDPLDPQTGKRDIWLHDLARRTEQRLTFANSNDLPVWSPDSLRVAYVQRTGTDTKVVVKSADGTGPEEVLEAAYKLPQDWTRDGRFFISATGSTNPKTGNDLWALPLSEGKPGGKPVPLRETEFAEWHGRVSRDGRWLAYMSNESKRDEVYVVGFPSLNGHWQISVDGGLFPVWSRDGRELYFVGLNNKMMAVEIKPGAQFQAGVPKPLFDVRMGTSGNRSYDVSADGRFLIATPVEQSATVPMTVVLNWQAGLKK